jgi:hypothetical protein
MLLGKRINVLYFSLLFVCFLTRVLFFSSDGSAVEILEDEDEDNSATLVTHW